MSTALTPKYSLWQIEQQLLDLCAERDRAESEGDAEAVKTMDTLIAGYLTQEVSKINSYAGLIRRREADAELLSAEADRLTDRAKAARADVARLKQTALGVMQAFGVKEFKTRENTLRRQANGGVEPVEIMDLAAVPADYAIVTVEISKKLWDEEVNPWIGAGGDHDKIRVIGTKPDLAAIRAALKMRLRCGKCNGSGNDGASEFPRVIQCPECNGVVTVPASVPGARLLERGEHVRLA